MGHQVEILADGFRFTECPRWHQGALYFVDMLDDLIYRLIPGQKAEAFAEIPHPGGLGWTPDGDMLAVSIQACEVRRIRDGKTRETISLAGLGYGSLNDMIVDGGGGAYVGGFGEGVAEGRLTAGGITYIAPNGAITEAADGLFGPNGMAISKDGKKMVMAETFAHRMLAFDIGPLGSLSNKRVWADFGGPISATMTDAVSKDRLLPDGISSIDADGAVWVADVNGRGVLRLDERGVELDRVSLGEDTASAVALGGAEGDELYIMAGPPLAKLAALWEGSNDRNYSVRRVKLSSGNR